MQSYEQLQVKDVLYVEIPLNISKETFIALLDHAEEDLNVAQVIACIDERRTTRDSLIKVITRKTKVLLAFYANTKSIILRLKLVTMQMLKKESVMKQ